MELRTAASPKDVKYYTTERLREEFLIDDLFKKGEIKLVYSHIDRIITGSAVPVEPIRLTAGDELRAEYFCQRRELGVINIGPAGTITIDGKTYEVGHKEGMYIGMGSKDITFASVDPSNPAKFYLNSAPAHKTYPTKLIKPQGTPSEDVVIIKDENKVELGCLEDANHISLCVTSRLLFPQAGLSIQEAAAVHTHSSGVWLVRTRTSMIWMASETRTLYKLFRIVYI